MSWLKGHSFLYICIVAVLDAAGVLVATLIAAFLTHDAGEGVFFREAAYNNLLYAVTFYFVWFWVALTLGLFLSSRKDNLIFQFSNTAKATLISLAFCGLAAIFLHPEGGEARALAYFGVLCFLLIGGYRALLCLFVWGIRQWGLNVRHVLLVGANERTFRLVDTIFHHARFGYTIIGILEDEPARLHHLKQWERQVPHLGGFHDLDRLLNERVVDEVHICLPVRSCYELIQSMAHYCVSLGVSVRMVADLFPLRIATSKMHRIENVPMLSLSTVPENPLPLAFKRLIDVLGAAFLLVMLSPVFLLAAIAIKLDSPGPVFFRQERVGLNQRRFRMIKFRSMVADAEARKKDLEHLNEADGPVFKIRNDPRVTRVGRFLRRTSIDELPQLLNVLAGEMSLVGPRPLPPNEIERHSWDQRRRLSVKPGMTGLWQVSGRSDLPFKEWLELDLAYIDSWSLFLDFVILLKTFRAVFRGQGAA